MALAALRPLRPGGARERAGDDVHELAALPPLHGQAAPRDRLLVALRLRRRHAHGVRRAADRGDRPPLPRRENYLADMDAGFYSADYLRAWIRNAQLREYLVGKVGEDWWRSPETGDLLRELFREGAKPTSEEIAERLGYNPFDVRPLVARIKTPRPGPPERLHTRLTTANPPSARGPLPSWCALGRWRSASDWTPAGRAYSLPLSHPRARGRLACCRLACHARRWLPLVGDGS